MDDLPVLFAKIEKKNNVKIYPKANEETVVVECTPENVPLLSSALVAEGAVFDSAFISATRNSTFSVYYIFRMQPLHKLVVLSSVGDEFYSVSESIPAAIWDERKMQDLAGIRMNGLEDSRPIIIHPEAGAPEVYPLAPKSKSSPKDIRNEYPMAGSGEEGEFEISVGPVHAGIIEPGHFRFHVVGEIINKLETRMFFLHRGVEKVAEGKSLDEGIVISEQIAGDESVANAVAYCQAVESLAGIEVPERAKYLRVVLLELERMYSHLADLGGMAMDIGFYLSSSRFMLLREQRMRLNAQLTGSRFLRGMCCIGGVSKDLDSNKLSELAAQLQEFNKEYLNLVEMTFGSSTFLDRTFSTGVLSMDSCLNLDVVGPVARASGVQCDLRKWLPYAAYEDLQVYEVTGNEGDVLSRYQVKSNEVAESIRIALAAIGALKKMDGPVCAKRPEKALPVSRLGFGWSEAVRGSCMFMIEVNDKWKITRFACRTASFRNWRAIEQTIKTAIVPDFPLLNKSFNLAYAGNDL